MANILSGKPVAEEIDKQIITDIKKFGLSPKLVVFHGRDNFGTKSYTKSLEKKAERLNIEIEVIELSNNISPIEAADRIKKKSASKKVDGIIIQSPIRNIDELRLFIDRSKDVDCSNEISLGSLFVRNSLFTPATAQAVVELLKYYEVVISKRNVVIVGRSTVVGKPLAHLLLNEDAAVTVCHSKTPDIGLYTKDADIVVSAAGKPNLVKADMINTNAVIVDVGINFSEDGKMIGDVDFDPVSQKVGAITPVPGGIGPITTSILLQNVVKSAKAAIDI